MEHICFRGTKKQVSGELDLYISGDLNIHMLGELNIHVSEELNQICFRGTTYTCLSRAGKYMFQENGRNIFQGK